MPRRRRPRTRPPEARPEQQSSRTPGTVTASRRWPGAALLVVLIVASYLPALRAGFVGWDDPLYVTDSPCVTRTDGVLISWSQNCAPEQYGRPRAWTDSNPGFFPITFTSFWVEWHLASAAPWLFHADNVVLHAANALLVWRLAAALAMPAPSGWFVAAIWALHPMQVESVAWITERKNVLYVFFYLLALLLLVRAERTDRARFTGGTAYVLSLAALALGLLSKALAMTFPAAVVLLASARGRSLRERRFWISLAPFAALSLAGALALLSTATPDLPVPPLARRLALPPRIVWFYFAKFFWPIRLVPVYPKWSLHPFDVVDALRWLALAIAGVAVAVAWRRIPRTVLFGIGFFLANLTLVAGIIWFNYYDYSLVADHFVYLASVGLAFAALGLLRAPFITRSPRATPVACLLGFVTTALAVMTFRQVPVWHDTGTLWRYTLARNPTCDQCHYNLALTLADRGDLEGAAEEYESALRIRPDAEVAINLGNIRVEQDRHDEALALYRKAATLDPTSEKAHYNVGMLLAERTQFEDALREYDTAIQLAPRFAKAYVFRGDALYRLGRAADAKRDFETALALTPGDPDARVGLARLAAGRGEWQAAAAQLESVLNRKTRASPAEIHREIAEAVEQLGAQDDAIRHYRAAYQLDPDDLDGVTSLVSALLNAGHVADAVDLLRQRLAKTPDEPSIATSLAWIRATARDAEWRDGAEAVRLAEQACSATQYGDADKLDTLAAAYAEAARFDDAVRTAEQAVKAADAEDLVDEIRERLGLYRARQPYRSPW